MGYSPKIFDKGLIQSVTLPAAVTLNSTTWVDILSITVDVPPSVKALRVEILGHQTINFSTQVNAETRLLRDGSTLITSGQLLLCDAVRNVDFSSPYIDLPTPGSHTYKIQGRLSANGTGTTITIQSAVLQVDGLVT